MTARKSNKLGLAIAAGPAIFAWTGPTAVYAEALSGPSTDVQSVIAAEAREGLTSPLPELAVAPKDLGDEKKYVIFHKAGVTQQEAEADLRFCWRYLRHGVMRRTPTFVPWGKGDPARPVEYNFGAMYGLIGVGIGAIIEGPLERSVRQLRFYSCMLPRGYDRYRTSEAVWNRLNDDDHPERSIILQARVAAGTTPPTAKVTQ